MSKLVYIHLIGVACALGCKSNPDHCAGNPGNNCDNLSDSAVDGDGSDGCTGDPQCSAPTPVCDLSGMKQCVQCTTIEASACTGTTPVCGTDDTCHACTAHAQCASDVCLPDGSCSDGTNVAYVDPTGTDNTSCTKATPCTVVMKALATSRPYVKFTGTTSEQVTINNQNVSLLADAGAQLTFTSAGVILNVTGTSVVTIYDLTIANGLGSTGIGISMPAGNTASLTLDRAKVTNNAGGGISSSGGTLTVTQSIISGNSAGGISVTSSQFTIENNFVIKNGGATSFYGGIQLSNVAAVGTHSVDFNTIAQNTGASSVDTGIACSGVLATLTFGDDIVYGNTVAAGGTQLGGTNCACNYCDVGPDTMAGTGNINADPLFVNAAQNDFHITSGSPCKDAADPAATLNVDIDGDSRPQGPRDDIGADEYKP